MENNNNNQNNYINSYLVNAFDKLGKSQKEVIKDLGKSQPYVSALMSGKKVVGKDIAKELANLYGFDEGSILTGRLLTPSESTNEDDFEEEENFLKTEREKYGLSLSDIAEKTHIPLKKLKEYEIGDKNIPRKILEVLVSFFEQVAYEYENYAQENANIPVLQTEKMISSVQVPYYDVDFAGGWTSSELFSQHKPSFVISSPEFARAEFACNLVGNSISRRIENGSIIGLRKIEDWQVYFPTNEIYGVVTKNGLRTVKIVKRSKEKGFLELIPDALPQFNNPPYESELIPIDYVEEFYQVTAWAFFERLAM